MPVRNGIETGASPAVTIYRGCPGQENEKKRTTLLVTEYMRYRAEIDGLRAVAVVPVILFHAGLRQFSGGFVGVDVFFVISGYLITTIILADMETGTFSLVNFYERRARRILPALYLVMLASLPFAWMWLMPSDMKKFTDSLLATSTFSSNVLFLTETGYWGQINGLKPLLHTWSLAVEEQYYLFFPLFLMLMWKTPKRLLLGSFVAVAAISLLVSQWMAVNKPSANFFLLPTRAWELAIGASIAFYFLFRKGAVRSLLSHKYIDEVLGITGLAMIVYAIHSFDETVPYPSVYTLIPTVGTGLIIIFSSPATMVGRFLGTRVLAGIGMISYSAYLWHQPLLAFARQRSLAEPGEPVLLVLSVLAFPLAYLSWRFVEQPFRRKGYLGRKAVFTFALAGSLAFICIGLAGHYTDGFSNRLATSGVTLGSIEARLKGAYGLGESCVGSFTLSPHCRTSDEPEILVWGDSIAMHLVQGILASNPAAKVIQMNKYVCGPFFDAAPIDMPKYPASWARGCLDYTEKVRNWLHENTSVKYAVLSSPFTQYVFKGRTLLLRNGNVVDANQDLAIAEFEKTLGELESLGITPVVFSPPPTNGTDLGRCLSRAQRSGLSLDICNFKAAEISPELSESYRFLDVIGKHHHVVRLDDFLCDGTSCKTHFGQVFLYRDRGHLTREGATLLGKIHNFYGIIVGG